MGELVQPMHFLIAFGLVSWALLTVLPFWFIFEKAGFNPLLSVLMIVPVVGLVMLYVLAFRPWKTMPPASHG
jgi:hypothetical protein